MTLHQLEYFCAVCRCQSITRAAEELYVSQPTISVAIRELEKEFKIRLFYHGKNKIALTADGEAFYLKADAMVRQSQELYTLFADYGKKADVLKVGIPPMASTLFFPRLKDAFESENDVRLQLYEYGSVRARSLIDERQLDLALVNMDFYNISNYNSYVLAEDSYVYCVSRTHRFATETSITFDMLRDEKIIFFNSDSVQNQVAQSRFSSLDIKPDIILYSSQLYTILNFVRGGDCGAFLFDSMLINPRDFVKIPIDPKLSCRFGIIWKKGVAVPVKTQKFIDFVKKYKGNLLVK